MLGVVDSPRQWAPAPYLKPTWALGQIPGDRMHAVWATSWETTPYGSFPMSWALDNNDVNGIDVTLTYQHGFGFAHPFATDA